MTRFSYARKGINGRKKLICLSTNTAVVMPCASVKTVHAAFAARDMMPSEDSIYSDFSYKSDAEYARHPSIDSWGISSLSTVHGTDTENYCLPFSWHL